MNSTKPLVSIALCTYNGEKYLKEQIESLVHQTYPNLEIIVLDDCSTDNTVKLLTAYAKSFPCIKLHQNQLNLGYIKNFEKCINLCNGEFIALADQDDIWALDKIEIMLESIKDNALVYHDSAFINQNGKDMNKKMSDILNMYQGNCGLPFLLYNCVSGHSLIFRRFLKTSILPFPANFHHDWWIAYVASERGGLTYVDLPLVKYRQHEKSTTDILRLKQKKKISTSKPKSDIDPSRIKMFRPKAVQHAKYLDKLVACFNGEGDLETKKQMLFLLLKRYKEIFFLKKKGTLSKLNYIRKMVRGM